MELDFGRRCKVFVGDDIEGEEYALVAIDGGGGDVGEYEASVVGVEGYGSVLRQTAAILEVVESVRLLCHRKSFGEFDATLDAVDGYSVVEEKTDGVRFVGRDGDGRDVGAEESHLGRCQHAEVVLVETAVVGVDEVDVAEVHRTLVGEGWIGLQCEFHECTVVSEDGV